MKVGDPMSAVVVPHSASKPYVINDPRFTTLCCPNFAYNYSTSGDTSEITPAWYAQAVWKGEKPSDVGASLKPGGSQVPSDEKELVRTIDHWNCLKVIHF